MSKRPAVLVWAGIASFLVTLVVLFPARVAAHWFAPDMLRISDVGGTLWSGSAGAIATDALTLTELEWRLKPLSLLRLRPTLSVAANPPRGRIVADVELRGAQSVALYGLQASLPLSLVAQAVRNKGLGGNARLDFTEVLVDDGLPTVANGVVQLEGLRVPQAWSGNLGGYELQFTSGEERITASIEDTRGVIDIAGTLTLQNDRSYQLYALLSPTPQTPSDLRERLEMLPRGPADDQYEIRLEGAL